MSLIRLLCVLVGCFFVYRESGLSVVILILYVFAKTEVNESMIGELRRRLSKMGG